MKACAVFAVVAFSLSAGCTHFADFFLADHPQAGHVDKAKLRELAQLPRLSVGFCFSFSSLSGFGIGEETDHSAEISRIQVQMKGDPSDAARYLLIGRHYGKLKRDKEMKEACSKAIAICRQQVSEHPDDMTWLARLGDALFYNDETNEAERLLRRVIGEAPNEWRGWLGLAKIVDDQSFRPIFGDKPWSYRFRGEKIVSSELMERKPTETQIAEMRRLWQDARSYYDHAVELAPRDEAQPCIHRIIANWTHALIEAGLRTIKGERSNALAASLTPESIRDLRRVASLSPDDPKTIGMAMFWNELACFYHKKLDMRALLSWWADHLVGGNRTLVDVLPEDTRTFVKWCMDRLEQLTKHSDQFTAAAASELLAEQLVMIECVGESKNVLWPFSAKDRQTTEKIQGYLRRAVQLDPSRQRGWELLIALLETENKNDDAIAAACEWIAIQDNAHNRLILAKTYAYAKRFDEAGEALRAGLRIDPKDLNCLLGQIALELRRGDAQSLQEAGEQLAAIAPQITEEKSEQHERDYLLLNGIHFALTDHPDRARAAFRRVLQMKKGEPTATRALAALDGR